MTGRVLGIHVGGPASNPVAARNLQIGIDNGVWGVRERTRRHCVDVQVGDLVVVSYEGTNPRVGPGGYADARFTEIHVFEVTAPFYVDDDEMWEPVPDPYLHRFRWRRLHHVVGETAQSLPAREHLGEEMAEQLRLSANTQGSVRGPVAVWKVPAASIAAQASVTGRARPATATASTSTADPWSAEERSDLRPVDVAALAADLLCSDEEAARLLRTVRRSPLLLVGPWATGKTHSALTLAEAQSDAEPVFVRGLPDRDVPAFLFDEPAPPAVLDDLRAEDVQELVDALDGPSAFRGRTRTIIATAAPLPTMTLDAFSRLRRVFGVVRLDAASARLDRWFARPANTNELRDLTAGLDALNDWIAEALDPRHVVGHGLFLSPHLTAEDVRDICEQQIDPVLALAAEQAGRGDAVASWSFFSES